MERKEHWEQVYRTRQPEKLGWYKPRLDLSLEWIDSLELDREKPVIDVGGGASTLVDDLIDEGFDSVTVLDLAMDALDASRKRLGRQSELVMWLPVDVTSYPLPPGRFLLWHDRGLFHFMTEPELVDAYRQSLEQALAPGAHAIIATFAPAAPPKCSGLEVSRYDADALSEAIGGRFERIRDRQEMHLTPDGAEQLYQYCLFRRLEA